MRQTNNKQRLFEMMGKINPDWTREKNDNYVKQNNPDPNYDETDVIDQDDQDNDMVDTLKKSLHKVDTKKGVSETDNQQIINPKYTHFAILKNNGMIVNGWDYNGYEPEELKMEKNNYFFNDIRDNQIEPRIVNIVTTKHLQRKGIDPFDTNNWNKDNSIYTL